MYGNRIDAFTGRPRRFVIVTCQRTGSTMLIRSLDSSPRIFCAGELFHQGSNVYHGSYQYPYRRRGSHVLSKLADMFLSRHRIRRHLSQFYDKAGVGVDAVGFKLMVSQIRVFPALMLELEALGVHLVFLHRRDIFATSLSYCRAKASGLFHSNRGPARDNQLPIVLDVDEFRSVFEACMSSEYQLVKMHETYGGPMFDYEDMVLNWDSFVAAIGAEIGIPGLHVPKALEKMRPGIDTAPVANESDLRELFGVEAVRP